MRLSRKYGKHLSEINHSKTPSVRSTASGEQCWLEPQHYLVGVATFSGLFIKIPQVCLLESQKKKIRRARGECREGSERALEYFVRCGAIQCPLVCPRMLRAYGKCTVHN